MLLFLQLQQRRPHHRPSPQIKGLGRFRFHSSTQLFFLLYSIFYIPQIHFLHPELPRRYDLLHCHSLSLRKPRPQHLMPPHYLLQTLPQRFSVQLPHHPQPQRNVVRRTPRLQLIDKPQPLLRIRQRQRTLPVNTHNRWNHLPHSLAALTADTLRHPSHRRRFKDLLHRQLYPQRLPYPRYQLHRQQRVPALLEKVVSHSHTLDPQHLFPYPAQQLLGNIARPHRFLLSSRPLRFRQAPAIDLPVGVQRQLLQLHHHRRHHVLRHSLLQVLSQPAYLPTSPTLPAPRHIPHLPLHPRLVFPHHHHCLLHLRMPLQCHLDLAQLNPVPTQLYLVIHPSQKFQLSCPVPSRTISRAIQPLSPNPAEPMRHKLLRRQLRTPQIPTPQSRSSQVQLSRYSHRHRILFLVQHVHLRIRNRPPNRNRINFVTSLQTGVGRVRRIF